MNYFQPPDPPEPDYDLVNCERCFCAVPNDEEHLFDFGAELLCRECFEEAQAADAVGFWQQVGRDYHWRAQSAVHGTQARNHQISSAWAYARARQLLGIDDPVNTTP